LDGQSVCGDRCVVKALRNAVLMAAIDALGHGEEAAAAAEITAATLEAHADESVIALIGRCHEALRRTRGVALSLGAINAQDSSLTWLGVGNVEGVLLRAPYRTGTGRADPQDGPAYEHVLLRGGVVGYQLPCLRASNIPLRRGDTLVFATDGIKSGFAHAVALGDPPKKIAHGLLAQYARRSDDALVLVARYLGNSPWNTP
jgi:hypothetical protein